MRIIVDEAIPFAEEAFAGIGQVQAFPGRSVCREHVKEADILLVRSVTRVNAKLLEGTGVRFVGTATIGFDHVDRDYLSQKGIRFETSAGSNANSVAEYVVAALLHVAERNGVPLAGQTVGVVGVGNAGSKVAAKCRSLGMQVFLNDPPRQRREGGDQWSSLDQVLWESDVVTLHTPLTLEGQDATFHLLDKDRLGRMKAGALLINTARGPVVDNAVLTEVLSAELPLGGVVLDVWESEPVISIDLLERVLIGTPHIAGYSLDGKVTATEMMYAAVCDFLGVAPGWRPTLPPAPVPKIEFDAGAYASEQAALETFVRSVYDIQADDAALRPIARLAPEERGAFFDSLRKEYPVRREFRFTEIVGEQMPASLREVLEQLGFHLPRLRSAS